MNEENDKKIILFLRELADSIENNELLPKQLHSVGDFYMCYKFQEQAIKDDDNYEEDNEDEGNDNSTEFSDEDLYKFLIMGWYIYCCIVRNKKVKK